MLRLISCYLFNIQLHVFHACAGREQVQHDLKIIYRNEVGKGQQLNKNMKSCVVTKSLAFCIGYIRTYTLFRDLQENISNI
jgi:hypothetical protein